MFSKHFRACRFIIGSLALVLIAVATLIAPEQTGLADGGSTAAVCGNPQKGLLCPLNGCKLDQFGKCDNSFNDVCTKQSDPDFCGGCKCVPKPIGGCYCNTN